MLLNDCHISFCNLSHRKDRLTHMENELKRVGIAATRFESLRPADVIDKIEPARRLQVMQKRTPGAIGCHFSQVGIMKEALEGKMHAWVMEDDLKFCHDIHERLAHIETWMETHDWDVIWMGGTFHVNPPHWHKGRPLMRDAEITDDPRMVRTYGCFCTYSYIVNAKSIQRVLDGLDHWLDRSMGIDWAMIQMQPDLKTFSYVPGCCKQIDNQSDIGTGITRFSGFKKLGPHWWQGHAGEFNPETYNWHECDPSKTPGSVPHEIINKKSRQA